MPTITSRHSRFQRSPHVRQHGSVVRDLVVSDDHQDRIPRGRRKFGIIRLARDHFDVPQVPVVPTLMKPLDSSSV